MIFEDAQYPHNWLGGVDMEEKAPDLVELTFSWRTTRQDFHDADFMPIWTSSHYLLTDTCDSELCLLACHRVSNVELAKNSFSCLETFIAMGYQLCGPSHFSRSLRLGVSTSACLTYTTAI